MVEIIDAADLRLLGPRITQRRRRGPVTHVWYRGKDGTGYEVIAEIHAAALADLQRANEVIIHAAEPVAEAIEEAADGRLIPRRAGIRHRWVRAMVHAPDDWEDAG